MANKKNKSMSGNKSARRGKASEQSHIPSSAPEPIRQPSGLDIERDESSRIGERDRDEE